MLANVSLMADALGAAAPLAEKCRTLSARAEYYLGEPENKGGRVRGEIAYDEWAAFQELVGKFGDASPPLKAFAQAVRQFDPDELVTVKEVLFSKEQDEQMQHDASVISCPVGLQSLLSVLDLIILRSKRPGAFLSREAEMKLEQMTGVHVTNALKDPIEHIRSARKRLKALLEDPADGRAAVHLLMPAIEAKFVSAMLWLFKETVNAKTDAPPELAEGKKVMDDLLGCAVRFFARLGDVDGVVKTE